MPRIFRYIGGAGVGKTTTLLNTMAKLIETRYPDPKLIGFISFTKAAREEAATRAADRFNVRPRDLQQDGWFRTIHSACFKLLGIGDRLLVPGTATQKWMRDAIGEDVSGTGEGDPEREYGRAATEKATRADVMLSLWSLARSRLVPLSEVHERASQLEREMGTLRDCERIAEKYEQAKRLHNRMDFTDLLAQYAGWAFNPKTGPLQVCPLGEVPNVPVWFIDEAQDNSALIDAAAKRLVSSSDLVYLSGDPFQCQPRGTPVLTHRGYKMIEDLDPENDRLIAFNSRSGSFHGGNGSVRFKISSGVVDSSDLFEIEMEDGTKHVATGNHKWICRTEILDKYATYLMKRGKWWRVGTVQMKNRGKESDKVSQFRLNGRVNTENADCAWILRIHESDRDARAYEQVVSCRFGIPQVTFRPPCGCKTNLDKEFIQYIFGELGDLTLNGDKCLLAHGLRMDSPLLTRGDNQKNGSRASRISHTCNLIPGMTLLPRRKEEVIIDRRAGKKRGVVTVHRFKRSLAEILEWVPVKSVTRLPSGVPTEVFGMDVEKHETYVTKGYVTHNSIFAWAGSDHSLFRSWGPAEEKILDHSYRCPPGVLELGEKCLRECSDYWDRGIKPRAPREEDKTKTLARALAGNSSGDVFRSFYKLEWTSVLDPRQSWLLLARTNFEARRLMAIVGNEGIPWRPVKGNGGWNAPSRAAALGALMSIEQDCPVDAEMWTEILKLVPVRNNGVDLLQPGFKARWERGEFDAPDGEPPRLLLREQLFEWGATPAFLEQVLSGDWARWHKSGIEFRAAVRRWGFTAAMCKPDDRNGIRVGTIHCSPGDEPVLTLDGYVPISSLVPGKHRLCGFHYKTNKITWGGKGHSGLSNKTRGLEFSLSSREYSGNLLTFTTERSTTRVTPCHRMRVRFAPEYFRKWAVYLMRRGEWWRIGMTKTHVIKPYVSGGIPGRLSTEQADDAWVLGIYDTWDEASFAESVTQGRYGIPGLSFESMAGRRTKNSVIHRIHEDLKDVVTPRVMALLVERGLLVDSPLYSGNAKVRADKSFETVAANVISGQMMLPLTPIGFGPESRNAQPDWGVVTRSDAMFEGMVYSLDVPNFGHYVSGGAIVHNSAKGMEGDNVVISTTISAPVKRSAEYDQQGRDEEARVRYVAATRARERVIIADERTKYRMEFPT